MSPDGQWVWDGRRWISSAQGGALVKPQTSTTNSALSPPDNNLLAPSTSGRVLPLWVLLALLVLDLVGFIPAVAFLTSILAVVVLLVIDARGLVTLNGFIKWKRMNVWLKILVGFLEFGFCEFLVLIYIGQRLSGILASRRSAVHTISGPPRPAPFDRNAIELALRSEVADAQLKLPADLFSKVQSISETILGILPRYEELDLASDDLTAVIKTATEYLPGVLQPYFRLPAAYVSRPLSSAGGKTAQQILSEQLDLLNRKVRDVDEALHNKDLNSLVTHEKLLESEFGKTQLEFSAAPFDPDAIQQALNRHVLEVKEKLPPDALAKVQVISDTIGEILPSYQESGLGPQELFAVQRTVDDYLPSALQSYLKLPAAYTSIPLPEADGKTAHQVLSDQLDLLIQKMREVADATHRKDVEALLTHGRFLEDKFGSSNLVLPT